MSKRTGIMLATMFTEKLFNKLPIPMYVQPKIEGDRLRAIIKFGKVSLLSSGGKERISIPHIKQELEILNLVDVELDGELYRHGMRHSEIRSIVSRTKNLHSNHKEMEYHVFDYIDKKLPQNKRLIYLHLFLKNFKYIKLVPTYSIETFQDLQDHYNAFLQQGYEGIIIRSPRALYTRKKCTTLLKLKPRVSEYFRIIDCIEEKDKDKVLKGTFGAFICSTEEGRIFSVGTGPTDKQRAFIWKHQDFFKSKFVKIRFQDYTKIRKVPKLLSIDKQWLTQNAK